MVTKNESESFWVRVCCATGVACFLTLVGMIIIYSGSQTLDGDEKWYLKTVDLLHRRGLTTAFFLELPGPELE